jgi:cobalt/nickel transport system permease protein
MEAKRGRQFGSPTMASGGVDPRRKCTSVSRVSGGDKPHRSPAAPYNHRMTLALHAPGTVDGWLRHRDPRWKLAAALAGGVPLASLVGLEPIAVADLLVLLLALSTGLAPDMLLRRLGPLVGMLLLFFGFALFWPRPDETAWVVGPLRLSPHGVLWLGRLVGKTFAIVLLALVLLETTTMAELGRAALALRMPGPLVHLFLLTQRYVFLIAEEFGRLRTALRVRGFRSGTTRHAYRTIGHVAGTLLVRSHDRADRVHAAMLCRGFAGQFRTLNDDRTKGADVVLLLGALAAGIGLVVWDRRWWPA